MLVASAATPEFPNNLVVFPDRDFLAVEGYQDRVGQTALIEVTRGGEVVGSAKATIAEGDPAIEVNHPGGACWGAGTDLNVTPDIRAGDKVSIKFPDEFVEDTIVQDAAVDTDTTIDEATRTVTVRGYIAGGVNPDQTEQRIVNPDLVDLIGKRDVRAAPWSARAVGQGRLLVRPRHRERPVYRDVRVRHARGRADRGRRRWRALHVVAGRGRRRQPPGPDHR